MNNYEEKVLDLIAEISAEEDGAELCSRQLAWDQVLAGGQLRVNRF